MIGITIARRMAGVGGEIERKREIRNWFVIACP
jgi:hypothetical protein